MPPQLPRGPVMWQGRLLLTRYRGRGGEYKETHIDSAHHLRSLALGSRPPSPTPDASSEYGRKSKCGARKQSLLQRHRLHQVLSSCAAVCGTDSSIKCEIRRGEAMTCPTALAAPDQAVPMSQGRLAPMMQDTTKLT